MTKTFGDHLYFIKYMSGKVSVYSYSYDQEKNEVTTNEEVVVVLTAKVSKP